MDPDIPISRPRGIRVLLILAGFATASLAGAATTGFKQTATGPHDYNDPANWVDGVINGLWDALLTLESPQTITFAEDTTLATGLVFNHAGNHALSLTSNTTTTRRLTPGGDVIVGNNSTANVNLGHTSRRLDINLGGASRMFSVAGNRTLVIFNAISNGAVVKTGSGILRLETESAFDGGLSIIRGAVVAKNIRALGGSGAGTVDLGDLTGTSGTTLNLGINGVFNNPVTVRAGSGGTAKIDNYVNYSPILAGPVTLDKELILSAAANTHSLTVSGDIGGVGGLTIASGGSPVILTGANTYSGPTRVTSGKVELSGTCTLASPLLALGAGATLDVSGLGAPLVLAAGQTLAQSTATTAFLRGSINAAQGKISLMSNGTTPAFSLANGTLTLSENTVVRIEGGFTAAGTYPLIVPADGGAVAGVVPQVSLFRASGFLRIRGGRLELVVDSVADPLNYHLALNGNDATGEGTLLNPWQSITRARDYLRTLGPQSGDITVHLRGGRYELKKTLEFNFADSGTNGHRVIYRSHPGETATLSGGKRVTGWTQVPGKPYWVAAVPTSAGFADYFRQLYVNGVRAERARSNWIRSANYLIDPQDANTCNGLIFPPGSALKNYSNLADLRLLHIVAFKVDEFPVTGISTSPGDGRLQVALQQPYCQERYIYRGGPPENYTWKETDPWMVVNAIEELDEPGEWCLNRSTREVHYYPFSYETMSEALVYAPVVETLLSVNGASSADKVRNLRFQDLAFEHGNWLFPRDYYIGGTQAEILYNGAPPEGSIGYRQEMPGQIKLVHTDGIEFLGNTIRHMGSCGIHPYEGARNTLIQGNTFLDLTGAAVLGGHWSNGGELCANTVVADNVIRKIGMDFMAGTLVNNLRHSGFQVLRNDMADSQYMGFHQRNQIGKLPADGQGGTVVASNRISLVMAGARYGVSDGGSIYSFGVWPDSSATGNDIYDLNQPKGVLSHAVGLYQDNDSYGWTWSRNVIRKVFPGVEGCHWVRYNTTDPNVNVATGNLTDATAVTTTGLIENIDYTTFPPGAPPPKAQEIINAAGVGPGYRHLLERVYSGTNLAQGKTAWASSVFAPGFEATRAVNWDYGDLWHSGTGATDSWWAVDLGASHVIQRLEIAARIDMDDPSARQSFEVQGANNPEFTDHVVIAEQNAIPFAYKQTKLRNSWIKYPNNPRGFRYLRVKKTNGGKLNFSEFQAYGYPAPANPTGHVWDAGANGALNDGGGEWHAPNQWWTGGANRSWADGNDVVIGNGNGVAGTVTVTGASPKVTRLTFAQAGSGTYILTGAPVELRGPESTTIDAEADAVVQNDLLSGGAIVKEGAGLLTLAGNNNFAGDVKVNAGRIVLGNSMSLRSSPWNTTGASATIGIDVAGHPEPALGGLKGDVDLALGIRGYEVVSNLTLDVRIGEIASYGGVIANGAPGMAFTKTGGGTQILGAANTYTGPTVLQAGNLALEGGDNRLAPTDTMVINGETGSMVSLDLRSTAQTLSNLVLQAPAGITASIRGGTGSLALVGATDLQLGPGGSMGANIFNTVVDLNGLANFTSNAPANTFRVGLQSGATNSSTATGSSLVSLAANSTITASSLRIGDVVSTWSGGRSTLRLGANNTLNVGSILLAASNRSNGVLEFAAPGSVLKVRNTNGTSAVGTWNIGSVNNFSNNAWTATADFSSGSLETLATTLNIGVANPSAATRGGAVTASLMMGAGILTAAAINLGSCTSTAVGASAGASATGVFTLNSPAGEVNVGTLILATNTISLTGNNRVSGTFHLTDGTLKATNVRKGVQTGTAIATAAFEWANGTIRNRPGTDLVWENVPVTLLPGTHVFDVAGGARVSLSAASPISESGGTGHGIVKTGAGTLSLAGAGSYTGITHVAEGELALAGSTLASPLVVDAGAALRFTLGSPATSTAVVTFSAGSIIRVTGPPAAPGSHTLMMASSITGTPVLDSFPDHSLVIEQGTTLKLIHSPGGYTAWAATNAGGQTAGLDYDRDGASNGIEYFLNAAPGFTALPIPAVSDKISWSNGGNIPASDYGLANGGQFEVQTTPDLVIWTPVSKIDLAANTHSEVSYMLPAGQTRIFARLVVEPE